MASIGHVAVGLCAGALAPSSSTRERVGLSVLFSALSLLPDADVVAFKLGIPYAAPFGHRGASHSIAFAVLCGGIAWLIARKVRPGSATAFAALTFAVVLSHPLLDALTDGGLGVGLLFPISTERFFFPWRPIPVAPIGARMISARGLTVVLTELVFFAPLFAYGLWPRRKRDQIPLDERTALLRGRRLR